MTTRSMFDRQLHGLQVKVQQLAQMVETAIESSLDAVRRHDLTIAQCVIDNDPRINTMRFAIEEECYQILALQQPVSHDMRFIVATISVVTNLERIGDYAAGIARLVSRLGGKGLVLPLNEFERMGALLQSMLHQSIEAYAGQDRPIATAVIHQDSEVDALHHTISDKIMAQMSGDSSVIEPGTYSLWISHNLERIGDRCANICERVNYLVTGELVHPRGASA